MSKPLHERETLLQAWQGLSRATLPKGVSLTQRIETRRAFYAGAAAFLRMTMVDLDDDGNEPTAEDLAYLEQLHNEMQHFFDACGSPAEMLAARAEERDAPS
jgi:hypothetical protein